MKDHWCRNRLRIEGERALVQELVSHFVEKYEATDRVGTRRFIVLRFDRLQQGTRNGADVPLDENQGMWLPSRGVLTDAGLEGTPHEQGWAEFKFRTPEAPPRQLLRRLADRYPTLLMSLMYAMPDSGDGGSVTVEGGLESEESCVDNRDLLRKLVVEGLVSRLWLTTLDRDLAADALPELRTT